MSELTINYGDEISDIIDEVQKARQPSISLVEKKFRERFDIDSAPTELQNFYRSYLDDNAVKTGRSLNPDSMPVYLAALRNNLDSNYHN